MEKNFERGSTLQDGNCSFSALYRSMFYLIKDQTHVIENEQTFVLMQRFMFALMQNASVNQKTQNFFMEFHKYLRPAYFLAEDEICLHSFLVYNKYTLIHRPLVQHEPFFVEPMFYKESLRYDKNPEFIFFECKNHHYEFLIRDNDTIFKLSDNQILKTVNSVISVYEKEDVKDIVCSNYWKNEIEDIDMFPVFTNISPSQAIQNKELSDDVNQFVKISALHFCILQNIFTFTLQIPNVQFAVDAIFVNNTDQNQNLFLIGKQTRKQLSFSSLNKDQLFCILRFFIHLEASYLLKVNNLEEKHFTTNSYGKIFMENFDLSFYHVKDYKNKQLVLDFLQNPSETKLEHILDISPTFNTIYTFLNKIKDKLPKFIKDLLLATNNDIQLLKELFYKEF